MMRNLPRFTAFAAVIAIAAGCGGKAEPEPVPAPEPTPAPAPTTPAPPAPTTNDDADRRRREEEAMRAKEALRNALAEMVHFDYDRSEIRSVDEATLDRKSAILTANPALRIRISGHADERGSDEYNLALGNRRAASVKRYFVNKGVDAGRLDVASYGEERPIAQGANEEAWYQNRRAEFEVLSGGDNLVAPQ